MHQMSSEMQACIDECLRCYQTCLSMASNQCLPAGGKHVEPGRVPWGGVGAPVLGRVRGLVRRTRRTA